MIAALYVEKDGAYYGLEDVDPWDEERDARQYAGPWPVVAHPPCARWSRLAGFTEARFGYKRGDDGGCFAAALAAVRRFGGVLEHPAHSKAWDAFGLAEPMWRDGWTFGIDGGASCYIEQGRYGLPVKKATWLYAYGCELPELRWGFTPDSEGTAPRDASGAAKGIRGGLHAWRDAFKGRAGQFEEGNSHLAACVVDGVRVRSPHFGLTSSTPAAFRDVLLSMARSAQPSLDILPVSAPSSAGRAAAQQQGGGAVYGLAAL